MKTTRTYTLRSDGRHEPIRIDYVRRGGRWIATRDFPADAVTVTSGASNEVGAYIILSDKRLLERSEPTLPLVCPPKPLRRRSVDLDAIGVTFEPA
jgi:hypothetical protein